VADDRPDALLDRLRRDVGGVLGSELVGMYLHGSLALGAFDPRSSDVDVLVVTRDLLQKTKVAELGAMHARIRASGLRFAEELEASYMPAAAVRRYDPANSLHPSIGNDWPFGMEHHDRSWVINLHVVREHGVVLWGPPPARLIDPVPMDQLRGAVAAVIEDFWARQRGDATWLATRKYQAYAVLTMCRALYTLDQRRTVSKAVAAAWGRRALGREWVRLIDRSLAWRQRRDDTPQDPEETVRFLRHALEQSRRFAESESAVR
jgi:hypothetical protein